MPLQCAPPSVKAIGAPWQLGTRVTHRSGPLNYGTERVPLPFATAGVVLLETLIRPPGSKRRWRRLRALPQSDPESLRWALELAERAGDYERAALLRKTILEVEAAQPVLSLESLVLERIQRAIDVGLSSKKSKEERFAAVQQLQVLASPPGQSLQAEDALHEILRTTSDDDVAEIAEAALWAAWLPSSDELIDNVMRRGLKLMKDGELPEAIKAFTEVVLAAPNYAEGWNKRATAFFLAERFDDSISDCQRVLKLKPRHFGCLSGLAVCHLRKGDERSALRWLRAALEVNPQSNDMKRIFVELEARSTFTFMRPRILDAMEELQFGQLDDSARRAKVVEPPARVTVAWNAHRIGLNDEQTYYVRVNVRSFSGEPISGAARYYALSRASGAVFHYELTQGSESPKIEPNADFRYSFMLASSDELLEAQGGILFRCGEQLFEVPLDRLRLVDAPTVQEADVTLLNKGYTFVGQVDVSE
mmetsp:Transcript_7019/g.13003  ORF Transcript_7019/g.13003 Transcript_7019/m.13003 type:complete len:477 (+) Transcript_7019:224-1654(+)